MAQVREYGYYIVGNTIKLVERDVNFDNDANSKSYGPGVDRGEWKSPLSAVTNGLQLEYTYIPEYFMSYNRHLGWNLTGDTDERNTSVYSPAYGEDNGYLTFFFPAIAANTGVLDMSALNTADRWIVVHNHPQWNGLHKVQTASANGYIKTYTKWSSGLTKLEEDDSGGESPVFATDETITISGATSFNHGFSVGDYLFNITPMGNGENEGLWTISALSSDGTTVTVDNNYYSDTTTSGELASAAAAFAAETFTDGDLFIVQVLLCEGCYIDVLGVSKMEDESFELDIPENLNLALEYYLKAKVFEQAGDFEKKEYFLKEFRKLIERHASTRQWGAKMIASGPHAIR